MMLKSLRVNAFRVIGMVRLGCVIAILIGPLIAAVCAAAAQGLWVANSQTLAEFQGPLASGRVGAHRVIRNQHLDGCSTIAFDRNGNLWATNFNTSTIVEFTKSHIKVLGVNAAPRATVVISQDADNTLVGPEGLVFDASGNMWVGS